MTVTIIHKTLEHQMSLVLQNMRTVAALLLKHTAAVFGLTSD